MGQIYHESRFNSIQTLNAVVDGSLQLFEKEQNMFEIEQKNRIKDIVEERFLVAKNLTKEQEIRPGMDMLVYDRVHNHLQVLELKYKIPVDSERDITNLDEMLEKAYKEASVEIEVYIKPGGDHHPHGLVDSKVVLEFIMKHCKV